MSIFKRLPVALVCLLLAAPILSTPTKTSENDPFRDILRQKIRPPDPPICCLVPLQTMDNADSDLLLSFEEWKEKQRQLAEQEAAAANKAKEKDSPNRPAGNVQANSGGEVPSGGGGSSNAGSWQDGGGGSSNANPESSSGQQDSATENTSSDPPKLPVSPHFRVPITDRFNYASLDCSARVHTSHRAAKSSSSILSSKRDRYMLSPCNTPKEKQFVVVELCEDIRIDTVQLANFEFFSGVFKDFTVKVAKTYSTNEDGWIDAGTYTAKNVRAVQSFHPPTSLHGFYRFIRIEFHSHYSNEYYCPISLLRVYGLTHLEEWKWEMWEAESKAAKIEPVPAPPVPPLPVPVQESIEQDNSDPTASKDQASTLHSNDSAPSAVPIAPDGNVSVPSPDKVSDAPPIPDLASQEPSLEVSPTPPVDTQNQSTASRRHPSSSNWNAPESRIFASEKRSSRSHHHVPSVELLPTIYGTPVSAASVEKKSSPSSNVDSAPTIPNNGNSGNDSTVIKSTHAETTISSAPSSSAAPTHNTSAPSLPPVPAPPPPSASIILSNTGGESIYRTIMNRLQALEANNTLYVRYLEEQSSGIREMIRRLGEDVGRIEGIGKAQAQIYLKRLNEREARQKRIDIEYKELKTRLDYLADEVVLEKRLGIAQLCLLIIVLLFMAVTRGSRGEVSLNLNEHAPMLLKNSMKEWSRRHLSFSRSDSYGEDSWDWVRKLKKSSRSQSRSRGRSPSSSPSQRHGSGSTVIRAALEGDSSGKYAFPTKSPISSMRSSKLPTSERKGRRSRSHTPSLRTPRQSKPLATALPPATSAATTGAYAVPISSARPKLRRVNSHSFSGASGLTATWSTGNVGPVPRSARKWARTAHLHEVRSKARSSTTTLNANGSNEGRREDEAKTSTPSRSYHHPHRSLPLDMNGDPFTPTKRRDAASFDVLEFPDLSPPSSVERSLQSISRIDLFNAKKSRASAVVDGKDPTYSPSADSNNSELWEDTDLSTDTDSEAGDEGILRADR